MSEKIITLKPEHTSKFWHYLAGFILIPVFGIGLYIIYKAFNRVTKVQYTVTDRQISAQYETYRDNVDLANIIEVTVTQSRIDRYFNIGTLALKTEQKSLELFGLKEPQELSTIILQAAEADRIRIEKRNKKTKQSREETTPGSIPKMDYLTGLWQQGLISNEDFEKERKHFESDS